VEIFTLEQTLPDGNGSLTIPAVDWLTIALICAGARVVSQLHHFSQISQKELWFVFAAGLAWQIYQLATICISLSKT